MKLIPRVIFLCIVAATLTFGQSVKLGDVRLSPRLLNYQGYLTDTQGNPVTNPSVSMIFAIFDAASAGNQKWTETQGSVAVDKGIFNVLLGSVTPIPDSVFTNSMDRYLELTVGGQILSPRTRIVSTAYAYTSTYADTAQYAKSAMSDNDWVRGTPDSILYTFNNIGLSRGNAGNYAYGAYRYTHVNFGAACTTGLNNNDLFYATVGGGLFNRAAHNYSTVCGGTLNSASGGGSFVGGGWLNTASGPRATAVCGESDSAKAAYAGIVSGWSNLAGDAADDTAAFVGGGYDNAALAKYSFVGGGAGNEAQGPGSVVGGGAADTVVSAYGAVLSGYRNNAGNIENDSASVISGGFNNRVDGKFSNISGGGNNVINGYSSVIAGGNLNYIFGVYAAIGGGMADSIFNGQYATIAGGRDNNAGGVYSTVGGGGLNIARTSASTVGGGFLNHADSSYCTVSGGYQNTAEFPSATVGGGYTNHVYGYAGTVSGGRSNNVYSSHGTIAGGTFNAVTGDYGAICGGLDDTVAAHSGFAANRLSVVASGHDYSSAFNLQTTTASAQTRVGILSKSSGTFTIDHPLDPENKILNHYFVESPDMSNVYSGSVIISSNGKAIVDLPDYFSALNRDPRVQLTGVGSADVVYVAEDFNGNTFAIGGKPGMKVYWTVIADRKDPSAEITRILIPVEQAKEDMLAGRSLDDALLLGTKDQLERMGKAGGFKFRHASEQKRYEEMRKQREEGSK